MLTVWDPDTYLDAVDGAVVSADWGDKVKDDLKALLNPPQARLFYGSAWSVPNVTTTALPINVTRYNTDDLTQGTTDKLYAVRAGVWSIFGKAVANPSVGGTQRSLIFRLNGASHFHQTDPPRNGAGGTAIELSTEYKLALGDYVQLCAYHDAGAALGFTPEFGMRWVGYG